MTGIATAQRYMARPSPLYLKRIDTNGISICTKCPLKAGELIVPVFVKTKSKVLSETALIDRRKKHSVKAEAKWKRPADFCEDDHGGEPPMEPDNDTFYINPYTKLARPGQQLET